MWTIEYTSEAIKSLKKIGSKQRQKIRFEMESLQTQPDKGKLLVGPLRGLRSLRVGNYRVIYKKENELLIILIISIGHRKDIYK
ncbi:MAG: type II toxin-antitoxin system RelE/ParE family toxin [Ignavibacteriales bacterium]|nr:MAG: type II toxin-antitoxin system RelE/ParE family toxin [Ignavibacteriales bacterium]